MKIIRDFGRSDAPYLVTGRTDLENLRCIVAGHSHTHSVANAIVADDEPESIADKFGIGVLLGKVDDEYWMTLSRLAECRTTALVLAGNQHNEDFLFRNEGVFDFVSSRMPDSPIEPGSYIVPEELLRHHFLPTYEYLIAKCSPLVGKGSNLIVLGTPPSRLSSEQMREKLICEHFFSERAKSAGISLETVPISPLSLRVKLWGILQDLLEHSAERLGASFLPCPPEAIADDGSLLPQYWAADATHANEDYGRLLLRELGRFLELKEHEKPL